VNYVDTGRRICEKIELEESGMTPEDCTWRLLAIKSPGDNLCDGQVDGTCQGDDYFTDDQWGIVVWCKVHLDQIIATGDYRTPLAWTPLQHYSPLFSAGFLVPLWTG
jgi:hypothetical protein